MSKNGGRQSKKPKMAAGPGPRGPRIANDPANFDTLTLAWQFHRRDIKHEHWGWEQLSSDAVCQLLCGQMASFEKMTWAEIRGAAGGKGKGKGTNHHEVPIDQFSRDARRRIEELHLDDYESVFSLRLNNTTRLYGVRDGRALILIWYDPHHGDNGKSAVPTKNG